MPLSGWSVWVLGRDPAGMNRANNTEEKLNERINGGRLRAHLSLVRALMVPYHLEETLGRKERGHFPANDHLHAPHKGTEGQPRSP